MDGKWGRIGSDRALVLDVARLALKVPSFPVECYFDLTELADARQTAPVRISWVSLFAKAYGLASLRHPELLRAYAGCARASYFESTSSVVAVSVNRATDQGDRLFFGRLKFPETKGLMTIQAELDTYMHGAVNKVFKHQILCAKMPGLVRRLGWWWRLKIDIQHRAQRVGTGSMSVLAAQGVTNRLHPCFLSSSLSYGPLDDKGRMLVTLQCDHRVIDGMAAARAINSMQEYLRSDILDELVGLSSSQARVA